VGAEDHGAPPVPSERSDEVDHLTGGGGIETGRRLVEEQQVRIVQQRPGEGHALAFAGGEPPHHRVGPVGHAELLQQRAGALAGRSLRESPHLRGEEQVLHRGEAFVETSVLGQHAGATAQLVALKARIQPEHGRRTAVGAEHAVQQPHGRGLAGAVRPEERQDLAGGGVDGQPVESRAAREAASEVLGDEGPVDHADSVALNTHRRLRREAGCWPGNGSWHNPTSASIDMSLKWRLILATPGTSQTSSMTSA